MKGAQKFKSSDKLKDIIKTKFWDIENKIVAAICASVIVIRACGIAKGLAATSHPCVRNELSGIYPTQFLDFFEYDDCSPFVTSISDKGQVLITSRGPGTAMVFALEILKFLTGKEESESVRKPLMIPEQ